MDAWYYGASPYAANNAAKAIQSAKIRADRLAKIAIQNLDNKREIEYTIQRSRNEAIHRKNLSLQNDVTKSVQNANNETSKVKRLQEKIQNRNKPSPPPTTGGSSTTTASGSGGSGGSGALKSVEKATVASAIVAAGASVVKSAASKGVLGWFLAPAGA